MQIFRGVQALRGLAALSVVGGHAVSARPDMVGPGVAEGALTILASGVDIFFVISGFIIASTAVSRPDPLEFVFRRAVRIYPVYWLVLLAAFVSGYWIALSPEDRPALDLGLIFAWTYPNWYIAPAWSIAFEMHFYAAVAVILAIAPERLFKLLFAALAVVAIGVTFRLPLGIYAHPLTLEFGAGVAIAYLVQRNGKLLSSPLIPAIAASLFAAGWYWIFVRGTGDAQLARVPTYGLGAGIPRLCRRIGGAQWRSISQRPAMARRHFLLALRRSLFADEMGGELHRAVADFPVRRHPGQHPAIDRPRGGLACARRSADAQLGPKVSPDAIGRRQVSGYAAWRSHRRDCAYFSGACS